MTADAACAMQPPTPYGDVSCVPTWAEVPADHRVCGIFIGESSADCGPYKRRRLINADVGTDYYYDALSGALVAVVRFGIPGAYCQGGPGTFDPPQNCTNEAPLPRPCDGGVD